MISADCRLLCLRLWLLWNPPCLRLQDRTCVAPAMSSVPPAGGACILTLASTHGISCAEEKRLCCFS